MAARKPRKLLAISSGGGHWVQLLRLRPAFGNCDVVYATVKEGYRSDIGNERFHVIPDANRWNRWALIRSAFAVLRVVIRERPDIVISTGAAPGLFGIAIGSLLGARTIWVDSIANGEELSLSGRKARRFAGLWLTQWPHLAARAGPFYRGSVL
ncbi:MAG: UDP-N-acetylglucosamine--LPS N-acetylglucosamine transferase [Steroidobacteraceae bacterium]